MLQWIRRFDFLPRAPRSATAAALFADMNDMHVILTQTQRPDLGPCPFDLPGREPRSRQLFSLPMSSFSQFCLSY